jgi:addiction module RelB/DinJ family antitoxin
MDRPVETEMVRFRIEGDLKKRAEQVCARTGMELNDVLRTLVRRIVIDEAIPFDLNTPGRVAEPEGTPYGEYGEFLTDDLAHLKADSVITLLASFAANRAHRIATEKRKARPNREILKRWETEAREAMSYRRTINTKDDKLLSKLETKFTALLTADH